MLALPAHGFVVLSAPKCASTALETALAPRAEMVLRHHPRLKHMNARSFQRNVAPLLASVGYERANYEVVTLFRDPVDWLHSWWRYRQGPRLKQSGGRVDQRRARQGLATGKRRWTGDLDFEEFATAYVEGRRAEVGLRGRPLRFVLRQDGAIGVDRIFAYERMDVWQGWFRERLGADLEFPATNRSRVRAPLEIDETLRARLEEHFAPEYEVRAHLLDDGQWSGTRGARLTRSVS
jgi:hypothetical protein